MKYIKQLDSLRGIAVLLVIITHWFPEGNPLHDYTAYFNGVDIFFALSGFLITKILLQNREEAERLGTPKLFVSKNFYVRRFLRIFPIYYAAILVLFALGPKTGTHIRDSVVYFLTYTSNFYFIQTGRWDGMLSHLWSLAVEEQFYLLWPWLVLFLRKKILLPLIVVSILVGIVGQHYFSMIATFCCFDGFGLGALLAWALVYRPELLKKYFGLALFLTVVCCVLQVARVVSNSQIEPVPSRTLTSICTITVIASVLLGKGTQTLFYKFVLNNRALIFLGKISYGVYLYHLMLPVFSGKVLPWINERLFSGWMASSVYLQNVENFCLLLAGAYLSWKLIEQPILRKKQNYSYQKAAVPAKARLYVPQEVSPARELE